jgi:FkbM family methyltransferase
VILGGALRGAAIYTSWHDYPGAILGRTEHALVRWFNRHVRPGETWLDVGAHYGYTAIALSRLVGPRGRVIAFEPVAATAACVARTRELNRIEQLSIVPFGLSDSPVMETVWVASVRGMADSTIEDRGSREPLRHVAFDTIRQSLFGTETRVDGVKIDVQGMELRVLRGMRNLLQRDHPKLIVEFHTGVDREAVIAELRECGYSSAGEPIDSASAPGYEDNASYVFNAS